MKCFHYKENNKQTMGIQYIHLKSRAVMYMYIAQKENVQEKECFDLLLFFCYLSSNTQCVAIYTCIYTCIAMSLYTISVYTFTVHEYM